MVSNRKLGNQFEKEFCKTLWNRGWWVLNIAQNALGQPADVIAVRNGRALLVDCKVCSKDVFRLSRIEPNQETAMYLWQYCENGDAWFALKTTDGVYMVTYKTMMEYRENHSSMKLEDIKSYGTPLKRWEL